MSPRVNETPKQRGVLHGLNRTAYGVHLAQSLRSGGVAGMAGGAPIVRRAPAAGVLGHVGAHVRLRPERRDRAICARGGRTASCAIGAFAGFAGSKDLRLACAQHGTSVTGAALRTREAPS